MAFSFLAPSRVVSASMKSRLHFSVKKIKIEHLQTANFNTLCSTLRNTGAGSLPEIFETGPDLLQVDIKSPAFVALLARLKISFTDPSILRQVLTHKSFMSGRVATNERLRYLGMKVIDLYAAEYYHIKYPHIPTSTIENVLRLHYSTYSLASIAMAFGMDPLIRFKLDQTEDDKAAGIRKIQGKCVQALVGAIYHDKGAKEARDFIHSYLTSRDIDPVELLPLEKPRQSLSCLLKFMGKEPLVSRLLKETGRTSNSPIFIVGAFSGTVKLGEGYGSSLKMAEFRACRDAIIRYFAKELKDFKFPSDMEGVDDSVTFFPTKLHDSPTRV